MDQWNANQFVLICLLPLTDCLGLSRQTDYERVPLVFILSTTSRSSRFTVIMPLLTLE